METSCINQIAHDLAGLYTNPKDRAYSGHNDVIKWKNFRDTGPLCGEFTGYRWIPLTKASDAEFWCFDLCLNIRLSKQSWGWWFQTPSHSLWHHCNEWMNLFVDRSIDVLWFFYQTFLCAMQDTLHINDKTSNIVRSTTHWIEYGKGFLLN